jgi:serine/threonine-protein kinase
MTDAALAPGAVIDGKYRVDRRLGGGAMGTVYAAQNKLLDTSVALKVLHAEHAVDDKIVARFIREARVAAGIDNEHVARVHDFGVCEGSPYIVYELLSGEDLAGVVAKEGPLPSTVAVDYVMQALAGVAAAHAGGIVHRDLKPANLFRARRVNGPPIVKVLDFGIAKALKGRELDRGPQTATSALMGSPLYMSPEQLRSSKRIDFRADIWSLGVTLYELLTGALPFSAASLGELLTALLEGAPVPLERHRPDLPPALVAVVGRCLERDRERRFQSVKELATALAPFGTEVGHAALRNIEHLTRDATIPPPQPPSSDPRSSASADATTGDAARDAAPADGLARPRAAGSRTMSMIPLVLGGLILLLLAATVAFTLARR